MCNCNKKLLTGNLPPVTNTVPPPVPIPAPRLNTASTPPSRIRMNTAPLQATNSPASSREVENPVSFQLPATGLSGETLGDQCNALGQLLGLGKAAPVQALVAAVSDEAYARSLLENRENTTALYELLNNPPRNEYTIATMSSLMRTNSELVAKAGKALLKWGFSGFSTVSDEMLQQREDACLACPNLVAPSSTLQSMTASAKTSEKVGQRTGNKVCFVCGCVVKNKMRIATETCPVENLGTPGLNRWGEKTGQA